MGEATDFSYQLFTIAELRDWLFHNVQNGLSDQVIARPRALAIVNNPHALPDDPVVAVVFDGETKPVGYTAVFAEQWERPALHDRFFWGSTIWVDPKYRGKGVSRKMLGQIREGVSDRYIVTESSIASGRINEKRGSVISYHPRYYILLDSLHNTIKSKLKSLCVRFSIKKVLKALAVYDYVNRYVNWIDDETYSFIVAHSSRDLFLRKQDFLNWQLRNPFLIPTGNDGKLEEERCDFKGYVDKHQVIQVQVLVQGKMCGYYALNVVDATSTVLYLYYEEDLREQVFASLATAVLERKDVVRFRSFNKELMDFLYGLGIKSMNSTDRAEQVSLIVPSGFEVDPSHCLQGGDGDMAC